MNNQQTSAQLTNSNQPGILHQILLQRESTLKTPKEDFLRKTSPASPNDTKMKRGAKNELDELKKEMKMVT